MRKLILATMVILCITFAYAQIKPEPIDITNKDVKGDTEKILDVVTMPEIEFFGTEYQVGDQGRVWLQILRNYQPVNNASCKLRVYYPNLTIMVNDSFMTRLQDSDAIYFYDVGTLPDVTGVYMTSATCTFEHDIWEYNPTHDAYTSFNNPNTTYGNLSYLVVGNFLADWFESYINFNISTAREYYNSFSPPKTIIGAWLVVYTDAILGNFFVACHRIKEYWSETNLTYGNAPPKCETCQDISPYNQSAVPFYQAFNVTKQIRQWIENESFLSYGIFLNATQNITNNFATIDSKEGNPPTWSPSLYIEFNTTESIAEIRGSGELHVSDYVNTLLDYIVAFNTELASNDDVCLNNV